MSGRPSVGRFRYPALSATHLFTISMSYPQMLRGTVVVNGIESRLPPLEHTLLCALLVRRGHPLPFDDAIEAMWPDPDAAPEQEMVSLKVHLWRLQQRLPGAIERRYGRDARLLLPHELESERLAA